MEEVLRTAIGDVLRELDIEVGEFSVEHPKETTHGDYACNVAMVVAKKLGKNPRELADTLVAKLEGQIEYVDKVEVAGPGFINFYLVRDFFVEETSRINTLGEDWGKHDEWSGKRVVVEYTDPNPFKEFHIGHVFTNTVGESLARLFITAGADTKRVNYQGDVGMHVAHALWGMKEMGISADSDFSARDLGQAYAKGATAFKDDEEVTVEMKRINKAVYDRSDDELNALYDKGREVSLAYFETVYEILGTKFDAYFFESEVAPLGKELVLANPKVFKDSDGAKVFIGEEYGLHTRVFLNAAGLPTYEAKELALAKLKDEKLGGYDHSVISTSNEISEYFKVLLKAMSFVYPELSAKTEHIGHGMVRLADGKMSSRTGKIVAGIDFINEVSDLAQAKIDEAGVVKDETGKLARQVAIAAIKYTTLKSNILQDSTFDKDRALSFEGDSGPYLQYTYARILSLQEKAKEAGVVSSYAIVPPTAYEVEKILYRFAEVTVSALEERAPHQVAGYLTELAGTFNTFYAHEKVADSDDEFAPYKLALTTAVGQTIKNGLWILGIEAPERM